MRTKQILLAAIAVALAGAAPGAASADADLERGEELFELCQQCHGAAGQGNRDALAPAIAGYEQWYIELQLKNYRAGIRGLHPEDKAGMRMYPMSRTLREDEDIEALAAYVSSLPAVYPEPELEGGDPARGKVLYTPCQACHGANAEGMEALGGPNTRVTNDWYLLRQLKNYKSGVRGTNPGDTAGMRMRPMSMTLADEQAMKDVIAYIMTLGER